MGLEGAYTEFVGQGEGLLGIRQLTTCSDLAEETQGMRLVATPYVGVDFLRALVRCGGC